jgi:hypothetical protein
MASPTRKPPARKCDPLLAATRETAFYVYVAGEGKGRATRVGATADLASVAPMRLLWFERLDDIPSAFDLAERIGRWPPVWRRQMIDRTNPGWRDLARQKPGARKA